MSLARRSSLLVLALAACAPPAAPSRPAPAPTPTSSAPVAAATALDLIVTNGRVVDGTGAPWFRADVGIAGGRIARVGDLARVAARRRIDARGRMVAPGFIDMLGQSEIALLIDNRVESKIRQGITTEITGEGSSVAPTNDALIAEGKEYLERFHLTIDWRDLAGYRRRFERSRSAINLGTFVGAGQVRAFVLGFERVDPTPTQLGEMEKAVDLAMEQGALGLSSSLIYPPDSYAKTAELVALAKVAARRGGVYATHIRNEADEEAAALDEAIAIGKDAAIPVEIFHLKAAGRNNWGKLRDVVARIERARADGVDVTADMYPYVAAMNPLSANIPGWAAEGGTDRMIARFHDPATRARIEKELWSGGMGREDPRDILLVSGVSPAVAKYLGKRLADIGREMKRSPEDALLDLVEADRGNTLVVRFAMSEEDVALGLAVPWVSLGIDANGQAIDGPFAKELTHPRAFGAAPRLLGHYARDRHLFTVEEAIRKMTSLPARRMGLVDRGLVRPGMAADLTVFDPAAIRDLATFEAPLRYAEGVDTVLVNGEVVLDAGRMTDARPGRFLSHH